MEVKVLSKRTEMALECEVNEFLHGTKCKIIDIKFSTAYIPLANSAGHSTRYSAMIVYDENM